MAAFISNTIIQLNATITVYSLLSFHSLKMAFTYEKTLTASLGTSVGK